MLRIKLKVIAKAKKEEVKKLSGDLYRVKVCAPPEKGKANKRVIDLLSEEFDVKRQYIKITSGVTSNFKTVEIEV